MDKGKSGKANWDPVAHKIFLDICVEEVNANNRSDEHLSPIGYENMIRKFNEQTNRNYVRKQFKNRWDLLKKEYNCWKTLNQKASRIGIDPVTRSIAATDEWWANEIQRNEIAAKFRYAPLVDEQRMSFIFDDHSVTNAYARVATPSSQVDASQINIEEGNEDGSGCELDVNQVTPTNVSSKGRKKRSCPYSPSPKMVQKAVKDSDDKMVFNRMVDLWERREISRNSATSQTNVDHVRDEIKEMTTMVVNDGGRPG
uniref:Myb/SANT-like domain-containing protein n=1 Tax=Triticum urartu TaxID=4572 RepID=A0A8R7P6D3_TRIUA